MSTSTSTRAVAPEFDGQQAGEGSAEYGRRALLFVLQHGEFSTFRLDDAGVEAALYQANVAQTAPGISLEAVASLRGTQTRLRAVYRWRETDKALRLAQLQGAEADEAADQPPPAAGDDKPSGGQKVKVGKGKPLPPAPPAFRVPDYDVVDGF